MNKHHCKAPEKMKTDMHGGAIYNCMEDEDGTLWVDNGEYCSEVIFCPYCGFKSKNAHNLDKIKTIAESYHDKLCMSISGGMLQTCECCGIYTYSRTTIEHDSLDFKKDLHVCSDCYVSIVLYWKDHKPGKISPI